MLFCKLEKSFCIQFNNKKNIICIVIELTLISTNGNKINCIESDFIRVPI